MPLQISTKGRYGLRAMVDMALHQAEGPLALRVIAKRQDISESYLEQVYTNLRKSGLVIASRGSQGGYELSRSARQITARQIIQSLEGPIAPVFCVDNIGSGNFCEREKDCITRPFWEELRNTINNYLEKTTLQDLADQARNIFRTEPMYYI